MPKHIVPQSSYFQDRSQAGRNARPAEVPVGDHIGIMKSELGNPHAAPVTDHPVVLKQEPKPEPKPEPVVEKKARRRARRRGKK